MRRFFLLIAVLLMAAGCDIQGIDQEYHNDSSREAPFEDVILSAYVGDGESSTKTTYNWTTNKILWTPGDKISLFYGGGTNGGECFTSTNTENSGKADFAGTISVISGITENNEDIQFWGIYPYDKQNVCDGSSVTVTVRHEQDAAEETFAQGHFISIGRSPGLSMGFYNLGGSFYFKLNRADIVSVKLRGKSGETLAGRVKVVMNDSGKPTVQEVVDGKTEVTVALPDGSPFTPGVGYYVICLPVHFSNGFEFEMTTSDGYTGVRSFNIDYTLPRNRFEYFKTTLDNGVEFTKEGNIEFADANVKAICVSNWDTNADGELSYTEAAAVTGVFPYDVFGGNTTITSFDEFQYFTGVTSLGYTTDGRYDEGYDYIGAFSGCSALKSIVLPSSLTDIGIEAFSFCTALETITIPATVTRIGMSAFSGCTNLVVTMESETPCTLYADSYWSCGQGVTDAFGGYQTRVKVILVPTDESVTAYQNAQYWSDYAFIIRKVGWVDPATLISFKDDIVELYCVENWDTDGDERLSMSEAAAVTDIGTTFKGVDITSFDELKFFTGISTIPDNAFDGCRLLKSISFPPQITSIGSKAFNNAPVTKVTVPSLDLWLDVVCPAGLFGGKYRGYTDIAVETVLYGSRAGALYINEDLVTEIIVPDGRTSIPAYMCCGLNNIERVVIPNGVTTIGASAFCCCTGLTSVNIPNSVKRIEEAAFYDCTNLGAIVIPEGVTYIGRGAFSHTTINAIPESLKTIEVAAFIGCSFNTNTVTLPSITSIGSFAFMGCGSLECINLPEVISNNGSSQPLGEGCFKDCTGLKHFSFPKTNYSYVSVSAHLFAGCTGLESVTLPGGERGLKHILDSAFSGCTGLKSIAIPETVVQIQQKAFYGCSGLETIDIGEGVSTIGQYAFSGVNAKDIKLPSTIQSLISFDARGGGDGYYYEAGAFYGSSIDTLEVYSTTLGDVLLSGFNEIKHSGASASSTTISKTTCYENVPKVIKVRKNTTTYTLPAKAFWGFDPGGYSSVVSRLEVVLLPNGLTSIGDRAFSGLRRLASIELPKTLKVINANAFNGCSGLTRVQLNSTTPPTLGSDMFSASATFYVPAESVEAYKAADVWSTYASRIQAIPAE